MRNILKLFGSFVLFFLLIYTLFDNQKTERIAEQAKEGVFSPEAIEAELTRRLHRATPNSPEARQISQQLSKVRRKAGKHVKETENPAVFFEALADLKTGRNGKSYPKNYKAVELKKANRYLVDQLKSGDRVFGGDILPWQERGPGNVSGRAQGIVVDVADPTGNTWFVATIGGGVWKTSDAGATWEHKTPELTIFSTQAIAQSQSNPDVFYVGTGMGYGRVVELVGNGVWKSTDHGETWFQLESTANGELLQAINRIVVDPNDENVVLVCSNDSFAHLYVKGGERKSGIFRTTDGGDSWTQVYDPDIALGTATDNRVQQIIANPKNFNTLYAAVNEVGVVKSLDGGLTWFVSADDFALPSDIGNPTNGGFGLAGISVRTELAISPTDTARLYAAVERPRGIADLYMTKDAGENWILVNDTGSDPNWFNVLGLSGALGVYTAGWFDNTIAVHPFDKNIVFVGGTNIYRLDIDDVNDVRSSTLIAYWLSNFGVPQVHADHHDLKMIPIDESEGTFRIVGANDGGIAVSNDGGTNWTGITGQNTVQFYSVDKKPGENVYIGGTQDNSTFHSLNDPGVNSQWIFDFGGDGAETVWHYTDPSLVMGSQQNGNYWRSTDGANSWNSIPAAKAGLNAPFISKIGATKSDPDLIFTVGSAGVNRSDDFGASWVLTPIQGNWLGYRPFDNVEVSIADAQVVWISSRLDINPPAGVRGGIHVSRDGGLSFTEISQNFPNTVTESSGIGTHPTDAGTAYFLFSVPGTPKILRTTDFGQTFEDLSGFSNGSGTSTNGFPDVAVFTLIVMPYNTDIIWVGTEIGLFVSEDGGQTWNLSDSGLPTVSIFDMKIVDDQVVVATYGRGIWSVTLPELAGYQPPVVTLTPRLRPLVQDFSLGGTVLIPVDVRDTYDSTKVFLDGNLFADLDANAAPLDTVFTHIPPSSGFITVSVTSYLDGQEFKSATRTGSVVTIAEAVASLDLDFDSAAFSNFFANGFSITTPTGFADNAIHSAHPYPNASSLHFTLTQPFTLSTGTIQFDEVVIVEPGTSTDWTNPNFFDFCVVEGSVDGITWQALAPGYDSRDDSAWLNTYNSGGAGTSSLYRSRTINVPSNLFAAGDDIFLRFRLQSDPLVIGWGWAIDNLQIQPGVTSIADGEQTPGQFRLAQNYPNPFNPTTTISYSLPQASEVSLNIYNMLGQKVRTLVQSEEQLAGTYTMRWNGRDDSGTQVASGTYIYRIQAGDFVQSRKLVLLR